MLDRRHEPVPILAANGHGSARDAVAFDTTAATDLARGRAFRFAPISCDIIPANDHTRDVNMASLREAGVGAIGRSRKRVPRDIESANTRNANGSSLGFRGASSTLLEGWLSLVRLLQRMAEWRSHTIVSNGQDDPRCKTDGANRQRWRSSFKQHAK